MKKRFSYSVRGRFAGDMTFIRVLVADDDADVRGLLEKYVKGEPALQLVGAATNADEAIQLADEHQPDAAILDVGMPAGGGVRAVREISECSPKTAMIALSGYDDRKTVLEMLEAGAISYLVKGASREDILTTLKRSLEAHAKLSELG
jgi:DNA-binding NarL/FixJ family response regulator